MPSILINTDTGATVTISKDGTSRQLVATNGTALFEDVEYGTWNVSSSLGGATSTDTIEVVNEFGLTLSIGQKLSSMPIKTTKLKIDGTKWILFARDHEGYPSGSQTLVSEYALTSMAFGSTPDYLTSNVRNWLVNDFYNSLPASVKDKILPTTIILNHYNSPSTTTSTENVFILSTKEVGGTYSPKDGTNIGFTNNAERVKLDSTSNQATTWFTRTNLATNSTSIAVVIASGVCMSGSVPQNAKINVSQGVVPAFNLSGDTLITTEPDEEGYYFIKGAEETTELLLSRALNALSILGVKQ